MSGDIKINIKFLASRFRTPSDKNFLALQWRERIEVRVAPL